MIIFHQTGTLRFGKVDVTEAQFTIMGIHIISGIFGPSIWMMEVVFYMNIFNIFWFLILAILNLNVDLILRKHFKHDYREKNKYLLLVYSTVF